MSHDPAALALVRLALAPAALLACAAPEELPSLYEDAAAAAAVADRDGFEALEPRLSGFVHGAPVAYWTIDAGGAEAMPLYQLCRPEGDDACAPVDHPPIVDAVPGDPGYSPFGQVHWVALPQGWDGRLASLSALEEEVARLGLEAPRPTSTLRHCAIAAPDVQLEVGPQQTVGPETEVYYRGAVARCFDFSSTRAHRPLWPDGSMFVRNVYVLTRDGEDAPLSESTRGLDLTGDGDQVDSNNVFGVGLDDGDYTPLWRMVEVTVPAEVASIDTAMDDARAEYADADDMFVTAPDYSITPIESQIVDFAETDVLINCPLQSAPGAL